MRIVLNYDRLLFVIVVEYFFIEREHIAMLYVAKIRTEYIFQLQYDLLKETPKIWMDCRHYI